jgi:hypothetical protein
MISKLKTILNTTFPSISTLSKGDAGNQDELATSTAERIGPNRVLLNARLLALPDNDSLGEIGRGVLFRGFTMDKPNEETVVVTILKGDNSNAPSVKAVLEKRATLSVKSETKHLSITFIDHTDRVQKSERIKIR